MVLPSIIGERMCLKGIMYLHFTRDDWFEDYVILEIFLEVGIEMVNV